MGKYRGHQDKSRRGREKKLLKKKGAAAGGSGGAQLETADSSPGRPQQQQQVGNPGAGGKAAGAGAKRKLKHVTYAKEHSVLICGDGDFSFTRGVIRHRATGCVSYVLLVYALPLLRSTRAFVVVEFAKSTRSE